MSFTHRISFPGALLLALGALAGCGGVQAGGQTGEESSDGCVYQSGPLAAQERSPLGFSGEQLLALATGQRRAAFTWLQTPGVSYDPESGTGELTLGVSSAGPARFARVASSSSHAQCRDHVRIPVRVTLATAGGALDESFNANLIGTSADEASVLELVPSADLKGAFAFSPGTLAGRRFLRLEVNLRFRADDSAGYLLGGIEGGDSASGVASFQAVPLACWGEIPTLSACAD